MRFAKSLFTALIICLSLIGALTAKAKGGAFSGVELAGEGDTKVTALLLQEDGSLIYALSKPEIKERSSQGFNSFFTVHKSQILITQADGNSKPIAENIDGEIKKLVKKSDSEIAFLTEEFIDEGFNGRRESKVLSVNIEDSNQEILAENNNLLEFDRVNDFSFSNEGALIILTTRQNKTTFNTENRAIRIIDTDGLFNFTDIRIGDGFDFFDKVEQINNKTYVFGSELREINFDLNSAETIEGIGANNSAFTKSGNSLIFLNQHPFNDEFIEAPVIALTNLNSNDNEITTIVDNFRAIDSFHIEGSKLYMTQNFDGFAQLYEVDIENLSFTEILRFSDSRQSAKILGFKDNELILIMDDGTSIIFINDTDVNFKIFQRAEFSPPRLPSNLIPKINKKKGKKRRNKAKKDHAKKANGSISFNGRDFSIPNGRAITLEINEDFDDTDISITGCADNGDSVFVRFSLAGVERNESSSLDISNENNFARASAILKEGQGLNFLQSRIRENATTGTINIDSFRTKSKASNIELDFNLTSEIVDIINNEIFRSVKLETVPITGEDISFIYKNKILFASEQNIGVVQSSTSFFSCPK